MSVQPQPDHSNAAAHERDRLRAIARKGVCPTCGRQADEDRERDLRSYAAANSRLHAEIVRLASDEEER